MASYIYPTRTVPGHSGGGADYREVVIVCLCFPYIKTTSTFSTGGGLFYQDEKHVIYIQY